MLQSSEGLVASPENRQPIPIMATGSAGTPSLLTGFLSGNAMACEDQREAKSFCSFHRFKIAHTWEKLVGYILCAEEL
jgi:hypothetical protein